MAPAFCRVPRTGVVVVGGENGEATVLAANAAFAAMLGRRPEELAGTPLHALAPEPGRADLRRLHEDAAAGRAAAGDVLLEAAGGDVIWAAVDAAPLDGGRDGARCLLLARDITREREAERALARATLVLELVTAAGGIGFWELDPATGEATWNDTLRDLAGAPPGAPAPLEDWLELIHPDDREVARRFVAEGPGEGELRCRLVRPDGAIRHVAGRIERLELAAGETRIVGLVVDVTDSEQAAVRMAETLESITEAHVSLDREWRCTYVNRHAEELLGRSRDELLGRVVWEEFPAAEGTGFERVREAMDEGRYVEFEERYGPLRTWFDVRAYPTATGVAVYFQNANVRRAAERERARLLKAEHAAREAAEQAQRRLEHHATHDGLTGLLNRTELVRRLDAAIRSGEPVTVLFIDLDRFKLVNDALGHAAGDAVLRLVGERLTAITAESHVVARLGGDEFIVGLVGDDARAADRVAERILEALREPATIGDHPVHPAASIGIAEVREQTQSAAALLLDADVALLRAKDAGRDRWMWFDEEARDELLQRIDVERRLRDALHQDRLKLHYQPAFDLDSAAVTDVEALARWHDPDSGPISPGVFIPVAEECGLIDLLGEWAARQAARHGAAWLPGNGHDPTFWINVSVRSLTRPGFHRLLRRAVEEAQLDPTRFGIEVTESAFGDDPAVLENLRRISDGGIKIAIDDFGTGYSSLARLDYMPIDLVKIDRAFIARIETPRGFATVAAIVDLAHAVGATTLAEGVETVAQLSALRATQCRSASGYLLAAPGPVESLAEAVGSGAALLEQTLSPREGQ